MRLTLRTLLAYLDDTLDPAQAKLIGQKVAESDTAKELMDRIKDVTRRRRLTAPTALGAAGGVDPNEIAAYLDNDLPAEKVAELEEACLASDVLLAEVAAAHQILTLVLGEPALVPPTARRRMMGLVQERSIRGNRKRRARAIGHGTVDSLVTEHDEADEALLLGLPLYRQSAGRLRWLVPLAAACLLIAAVAAVWMLLWQGARPVSARLGRPGSLASATLEKRADQAEAAPNIPAKNADNDPKPAPDPVKKTLEEPKPAAIDDKNPREGANADSAPVKEPRPEPKPPVKQPSPRQVRPPVDDHHELGKTHLEAPAILLLRGEDETWQRVRPDARVTAGDYLLSFPGSRSELRGDSGINLTLWGNVPEYSPLPVLESAATPHTNPEFDLDFTLERGRVVVSNRKKAGPAHVRVRFLDEVWDLTLDEPGNEVSLELVGTCLPLFKGPGGNEPAYDLYLLSLKGQNDLEIRYERFALPESSVFTWGSDTGNSRVPRPLPHPPEWWANKQPPKTQPARDMTGALDGLANRFFAKDKLDVVLAETLHDPQSANRRLAIRCLGALKKLADLVDALGDEQYVDVRLVAIEELRHLLGLSAHTDQELVAVLRKKNYTDQRAHMVVELLHGYSDQQIAAPAVRAMLAEYLEHEKLIVRQLAYYWLATLVPEGRKIDYDPAAPARQRENAATQWRQLLAQKSKEKPAVERGAFAP